MIIKIFATLFISVIALHAQDRDIINQQGYLRGELIYSLENKPTPQCHASTIAEMSEGLITAWFGGTEEKNPDVGIWISKYINGYWSKPAEVANGIQNDSIRYPCWNPVLFQPSEGPLFLFYKVGPDPQSWWGMVIYSNDNGKTWSKPKSLPDSILGPIKNKPVQLSTGEIISPSSTENDGWKVHIEVSSDLGNSWKKSGPLNDEKHSLIQPTILIHNNKTLQLLCRSKEGFIIESHSSDNGKTWEPFSELKLPNPNSGIDAVTLNNGRHLLVYNHTGMIEGRWGGLRTPLNIALSDDGINWIPVLILEKDEENTLIRRLFRAVMDWFILLILTTANQ